MAHYYYTTIMIYQIITIWLRRLVEHNSENDREAKDIEMVIKWWIKYEGKEKSRERERQRGGGEKERVSEGKNTNKTDNRQAKKYNCNYNSNIIIPLFFFLYSKHYEIKCWNHRRPDIVNVNTKYLVHV